MPTVQKRLEKLQEAKTVFRVAQQNGSIAVIERAFALANDIGMQDEAVAEARARLMTLQSARGSLDEACRTCILERIRSAQHLISNTLKNSHSWAYTERTKCEFEYIEYIEDIESIEYTEYIRYIDQLEYIEYVEYIK